MRNRLLIPCLLSAFAAQGLAQTSASTRQDIPRLVASARGTVVLLKTFDRQGTALGLGSGFRISGGRFVTNAHVVAGASRVEIFDDTGALLGIARSADMLSTTVDLAILPSVGPQAPYLSLSRMSPAVGEQVIVIGAPEGLTNTVSDGIVSAQRKIGTRQLLQISAPISPGSSGGPVLNSHGEVVGVSVSILREGQNLNFAVPVSDVIALVSSRPGQFEFPASTEDDSRGSTRLKVPSRSTAGSPPVLLTIGSRMSGQITPDDELPSGGHIDYYRLREAQGESLSIFVTSDDFTPFVSVFRLEGDRIVAVTSDTTYYPWKVAKVNWALSSDVTYFIGISATDASRSKMGGYSIIVVPEDPAPSPSRATASEGRWLGAATGNNYYSEFDRTRITSSGYGKYLVWERGTYRTPYTSSTGRTYDVVISQYEISCSDNRYRFVSGAAYSKGETVWSSSTISRWENAIPESIAEAEGLVICAYIKAHGL